MSDWPVDQAGVHTTLKKVLASGALLRIPKHPTHRQIVMALISLHLERRYPYTELELKDVLTQALSVFRAQVDHVTCRRYLVDLGFMKRDRAGSRYYLNFPQLEATLGDAIRLDDVTHLVQQVTGKRG